MYLPPASSTSLKFSFCHKSFCLFSWILGWLTNHISMSVRLQGCRKIGVLTFLFSCNIIPLHSPNWKRVQIEFYKRRKLSTDKIWEMLSRKKSKRATSIFLSFWKESILRLWLIKYHCLISTHTVWKFNRKHVGSFHLTKILRTHSFQI